MRITIDLDLASGGVPSPDIALALPSAPAAAVPTARDAGALRAGPSDANAAIADAVPPARSAGGAASDAAAQVADGGAYGGLQIVTTPVARVEAFDAGAMRR